MKTERWAQGVHADRATGRCGAAASVPWASRTTPRASSAVRRACSAVLPVLVASTLGFRIVVPASAVAQDASGLGTADGREGGAPTQQMPRERVGLADGPVFEAATSLERVLPQSSVYDILEDAEGFLWFATREGVARWDGYDVRTWTHDPFLQGSLPGNIVRRLVQDGAGDVWASTQDYLEAPAGVARIRSPRYDVVERIGLPGASIVIENNGAPVFVTPDSVFRWDDAQGAPVAFAQRAQRGRTLPNLYVTSDGELWVSDASHLERCSLEIPVCDMIPVEGLRSGERLGPLLEDGRNRLRIGSSQGLLSVSQDRSSVSAGSASPLRSGEFAVDLVEDAEGAFWVLGDRGVARLREGEPSTYSPLPILGERSFLAPISLHVDRAQNVWVGTVWGVFVHFRHRKRFGHLEHNPDDRNSLGSGLVSALAESDDGTIWIGTIGGGVNRWDRRSNSIRRVPTTSLGALSAGSDVVWDLVAAGDTIWAGTGSGLGVLRPGEDRFRFFYVDESVRLTSPRVTANTINDLALGPDGRLWISCPNPCSDTLRTFTPSAQGFGAVGVPGLGVPGYLGLGNGSRLFIGGWSGIHSLDVESGVAEAFAPRAGNLDGVLSLVESVDGGLWVGANSGLYRFDSHGTLLGRLTTDDGLPSNAVYGLVFDTQGLLWASTNRGLVRVDPAESVGSLATGRELPATPNAAQIRGDRPPTTSSLSVLQVFDPSTGLRNLEFNRNAYLSGRDGTLYFGGDRGLTYFRPGEIRDNPYTPPVRITALLRAGSRGLDVESIGRDAVVEIPPSEETFGFQFAALSYVNPHRNRYQIMLAGHEDRWRDLGTARQVTYSSVPPGTYEFMVRGANEDGVWGPEPARITVAVVPWFWETGWFRAVAGAALLSLIVGMTLVVTRARYRLQITSVRAARELEQERGRISRDMHDEVGASLTEIAILSDRIGRDAGTDEGNQVLEHVGRIGDKARVALDSIRGIIWATDPGNEDGSRVSAFLREYAGEVVEAAGVDGHFDFPPPGVVPRTSPEVRRTLFLVLKESLTNVLRHGRASRVDVRFVVDGRHLVLSVADDGVGFEIEERSARAGHQGLGNMAHRAQESGGTFVVHSASGEGTQVQVRVPWKGVDE